MSKSCMHLTLADCFTLHFIQSCEKALPGIFQFGGTNTSRRVRFRLWQPAVLTFS